ncbi:MAG: metallophosphoesterase [Bacillus sp. (in: firmicutes)]
MDKKLTKRSFIKYSLQSILALAGLGTGTKYYAENIEPVWVDIVHHTIFSPYIPKGFSKIKLVQFSDTHLGYQFGLKQLRKTVSTINSLSPDIVIFSGDLFDNPSKATQVDEIVMELIKIKAPLGKFSIYGNHDHGGNGSSLYANIMETSQFLLLRNNHVLVHKDGGTIAIAGVDDAMLGQPDIRTTLAHIKSGHYTILLSHAPDIADQLDPYNVHLQLSGHSHGGQVRLPFYGPLITPPFAKTYTAGHYSLATHDLYVNRGLGTTRYPVRFLCRPEITLFTFH